jgi:hypothetical protein
MPIVATAVPKRPPPGSAETPILYEARIAAEIAMTGARVHSSPIEMPAMMLVAGPVWEASAISRTGRYLYSV